MVKNEENKRGKSEGVQRCGTKDNGDMSPHAHQRAARRAVCSAVSENDDHRCAQSELLNMLALDQSIQSISHWGLLKELGLSVFAVGK